MSNDLVSQQLSVPGNQMAQLQPLSSKLEPPMQTQLIGLGTNEALQQHISSSNMSIGEMEPMLNNSGSRILSISDQQRGQILPHQAYNLVSEQYLVPNNPVGGMGTVLHGVQPYQSSTLSKRKMPMEPMASSPVHQKLQMPSKRVAQMEHRPWLQPVSAPNNRVVQMQAISNNPGSQPSELHKKPVPSKSGLLASKVKPVSMQASPKAQSESLESVRSKMRESLTAALALVFQSQGDSSSVDKNSQSEASPGTTQKDSDAADSISVNAVPESAEFQERLPSNEDGCAHENVTDAIENLKCDGQKFQSDNLLSEEDVSFSDNIFVRDELLQGNGLSWVLEPEIEIVEKKEIQTVEKKESDAKKVTTNNPHQPLRTPKILAFKIEAELFKLFGGVNKKYKEKGRSLLFNLKDRNNPELRERVMSGDIPPERLCCMSAEELASKELSQWRQAKAEELAQMVVLPDTEVDMRRLVKKTHKGEFQVEVEQADSASVEVSAGATTLTRRPKTEAKKPTAAKIVRRKDEGNVADEKVNLEEEHNVSSTITIPSTEGTDPMQLLMGEDELKDTKFLPPIVSLDEFMQSLDSEPPFENLPGDGGKSTPISVKDDSEVRSESKTLGQSSQDTIDGSPDKPNIVNEHNTKYDADVKSGGVPVRIEDVDSDTLKGEQVWEGLLQLNVLAATSVVGIFKSGEKTSTKEWPSLLEIKGRVKLDAFEKFLQELPMSRSRAVMVVHFVCKEAAPKCLGEVAVTYVSEGRVGFAEPAPGTELYLCPPHSKTLEMFAKILAKNQLHPLDAIDNGLIGVVVWRRAQLISPSHHKHISRKQHITSSSRRPQEKDTNMNSSNFVSKPIPSAHSKPPPDVVDDDDDDEVPPGFGPGDASRDEDDLPEFNFSSGTNPSGPQPYSARFSSQGPGMVASHLHARTPTRPMDQIRQLIHKYGQPSAGITSTTWNNDGDDDDDDIPEWQPQMPKPDHQVARSPTSLNSFQKQIHRPQEIPHQVFPDVYMQGQPSATQPWQQAPGWGALPDPRGQAVSGVQFYGIPSWPKDAPKSRGF